MPIPNRHPRDAQETVWLARCPKDSPGFPSAYVFATPNPPRLELTAKHFRVWNYGFTILSPDSYHRLFNGLRLRPCEGPRKVSLQIERAASGPWIARQPPGSQDSRSLYVFGTHPHPTPQYKHKKLTSWSHSLWYIDVRTFPDIFSGVPLAPNASPTHVSITATAVD